MSRLRLRRQCEAASGSRTHFALTGHGGGSYKPGMTRQFVWGLWLVLSVAGAVYLSVYARNCPFMDEWMFLDAFAGKVDDPVQWAWEAHSEHRFPATRLLYLGLFRLTGDLRTAMWGNLILLSASAAIPILAALQIRGRTSLADAFFPLAFLHPGHGENLMMSYQICITTSVALGAALAALTVAPHTGWGWKRVIALGAAASALPFTGSVGVMLAAGALLPLALLALLLLRDGETGKGMVVGVGALLTAAGVGAILVNYPGRSASAAFWSVPAVLGFTTRLTAMPFGPAAAWLWPAGLGAVLGVSAATAWALLRPGNTAGRVAALTVPLGSALVAFGLVWGRGWSGAEGVTAPRYAAMVLPGVVAVYLIAVRYGGRWVSAAGPIAFALLAAVAWPSNAVIGEERAGLFAGQFDGLKADVEAGLPAELIGQRYDWQLWLAHAAIESDFERAGRLGFPAFRNYRSMPTPVPVPLPVPDATNPLRLDPPAGAIAVRLHGAFEPRENRMAELRIRVFADGTELRVERFKVVKNVPVTVVIRLPGSASRVEVLPAPGDGVYRVTAVEVFSAH